MSALVASPADPREARCRAGTATVASNDCFLAGSAYDRGTAELPSQQGRAIELFALGCKEAPRDPRNPSCLALKNEVVSLQLVVSRRGEALALLDSACSAGSLDLCNDLATAYAEGIGTTPRPAKAAVLYERTCGGAAAPGGVPSVVSTDLEASITGCAGLASLVRAGAAGVERDLARAAAAEARRQMLGKQLAPPR